MKRVRRSAFKSGVSDKIDPMRFVPIHSTSEFSVSFDSVVPTPNVDSFAPDLLAPEGLPFGSLPSGYPRRVGALRANLQLEDESFL